MNISLIQTILTVSQCRSFLEASYELNYTPAVVSKHISKAEQELGIKLFTRGSKSNSMYMTPECILIMEDLQKMMNAYEHMLNTISSRELNDENMVINVGSTVKNWYINRDEIISNFIIKYPNIKVEQTLTTSAELMQKLDTANIDCAFIECMDPFDDNPALCEYRDSHDFEFTPIGINKNMYLAVSDSSEFANVDEAPFSAFNDYRIAFTTDPLALTCKNNSKPFEKLSKKYGFPLQSIALTTADSSSMLVAQHMKVAIPMQNPTPKYDGIHYVRLTDWEETIVAYLVTCERHYSRSAKKFSDFVHSYISRKNN